MSGAGYAIAWTAPARRALVRLPEKVATAVVEVTGLRNPCLQLEGIHSGLMQAVLDRDADDWPLQAGN